MQGGCDSAGGAEEKKVGGHIRLGLGEVGLGYSMNEPQQILGWDAAWTPHGSGAWCLVEKKGKEWQLMWNRVCPTGEDLLEKLHQILEENSPGLIAVDLPVSRKIVTGYREADRQTTRAFSKYGCPVHSPNPDRPGEWGEELMSVMRNHGFEVQGTGESIQERICEVYPHTVCLDIVRAGYRVPYKIQRATKYFPDLTPPERKDAIAESIDDLLEGISHQVRGIPSELKGVVSGPLRAWKEREDRVDALLCAVAGIGIQAGRYLPFGSEEAAIWNPNIKQLVPAKRMH